MKSKDDAEKLLENLYKESDFVWKSEGRCLFKSKQNVPNMIKPRANQVTDHEVKEYVRNMLFQDVFKDDARCAFFSDPSLFSPSEKRLNVLVAMYWDDNVQGISKDARRDNQRLDPLLKLEGGRRFKFIITDPPYYDDVQYPEMMQLFQVWHARSIGHLLGIQPVPNTAEELSVGRYRDEETFEKRTPVLAQVQVQVKDRLRIKAL